jgi:uncharacterized DUF497 family protein
MYDVIYKNRYIWNREKAEINYRKHNIHFEQATGIFEDLFAVDQYDDEHSDYEDRYCTTGRAGILITVSYTMRDQLVRIFSARKADGEEKEAYERSIRAHLGER